MTNVNPFVAGKLWICFSPMDQELTPMHKLLAKTRASVTSFPGVELDLQSNAACEIRFPWCGQLDGATLTVGAQLLNVATVYIFALTPLIGIGTASVPIQIMGWLENIELRGPTFVEAVLQGATEAPGPITQISGKVHKAASLLTDIPLVGTVASAVSWVSNVTNKVASVFGWSRPVDGSGNTVISNVPARGFTHFTGTDNAIVLGMASDNAIAEQETNFLEDVDEMSVAHVCARPCMISSTEWKTGARVPVLAAFNVGPAIDSARVQTSGNLNMVDMGLFEATANQFGMWRADIHFRVSVARTPFHVGRLEVIFLPGTIVGPLPNDFDATNCWRHVLDITETNELEFVVPFQHVKVMCATSPQDSEANLTLNTVGTVLIRPLTQLSAPDTTAQSVWINVWKWATNVALSMPQQSCHWKLMTPPESVRATLQGVVDNSPSDARQVAFGANNTEDSLLRATTTVAGEICLNLRQATRSSREWQPFTTDTIELPMVPATDMTGFVGYCSSIFSFYRGGLNVKILSSDNKAQTVSSWLHSQVSAQPRGQGPLHMTFPALNPVHEVQVPFFSTARRGLCNSTRDLEEVPKLSVSQTPSGANPSTRVLLGGKDDLTFGFLIGPPLMGFP